MAFKGHLQPKPFHGSQESHLDLSGSSPFRPWLAYLDVCGELLRSFQPLVGCPTSLPGLKPPCTHQL